MNEWIYYGIIAAVFISFKDIIFTSLIKKYSYTDLIITTNIIIFIFTMIYLLISKKKIKKLNYKDTIKLVIQILLIYLIINPCIYKSMKDSTNPGNAKAIINLNTILTLILSFYILKKRLTFKNAIIMISVIALTFNLE